MTCFFEKVLLVFTYYVVFADWVLCGASISFLLYTVWLRVLSPMCRHLKWKCKYIPFRQFNGVAGKGDEKYNVHGIKKLKEK